MLQHASVYPWILQTGYTEDPHFQGFFRPRRHCGFNLRPFHWLSASWEMPFHPFGHSIAPLAMFPSILSAHRPENGGNLEPFLSNGFSYLISKERTI